ncbi:hypothetical protein J6590_021103 [Homalodisca vitripennis]|nr:hypothetical protein J6590_021103 [Homalodisca vitripennis]
MERNLTEGSFTLISEVNEQPAVDPRISVFNKPTLSLPPPHPITAASPALLHNRLGDATINGFLPTLVRTFKKPLFNLVTPEWAAATVAPCH